MAEFDILSQLKGPDISVSLFGDASLQGAKLGEMIPTVTTARIRGAIEGYKTGLDFIQKSQENEKRRQELQYLPQKLETEALNAQAELKNNNAIAEMNTIKANISRDTEELQIYKERDTLRADAAKAQTELSKAKIQEKYYTDQKSLDRETFINNVIGGKYSIGEGDWDKTILAGTLADLENMDPQKALAIENSLGRDQVKSGYARRTQARQDKLTEAMNLWEADSLGTAVEARLGMPAEEAIDHVDIVPANQYNYDADGLIERDASGKYKVNKIDPLPKSYDAIDKRTGKLITHDVTPDSKTKKERAGSAKKFLTGEYAEEAANTFTANLYKKKGPAAQGDGGQGGGGAPPSVVAPRSTAPVPAATPHLGASKNGAAPRKGATPSTPQGTPSTPQSAPVGVEPQEPTVVQETFKITPEAEERVKPLVSTLEKQITDNLTLPSTTASRIAQADTVNNLVRAVADEQYQLNPNIYSMQDVEDYNRKQTEDLEAKANSISFFGDPFQMRAVKNAINSAKELSQVSTPQDLYYVSKRGIIRAQVDMLAGNIKKRALELKRSQGIKATLPQVRTSKLSAVIAGQ